MEYLTADFTITCPNDLLQVARDLLADAAASAGFESFEDTDKGLKGYVQKAIFDKSTLDNAINDFHLQDTSIIYTLGEAENKDWNEKWEKDGFEPINIDNKIIIEDSNQKTQTFEDGHNARTLQVQRIKIDAKLAFGTGTHETTQMIVSTLLYLDLSGKHVLDCGCGTGILSIAASKLGARDVVGYDIDEWSVENTKHNSEINDVHNINVYLGDSSVIKTLNGPFDIILANINRNILLNDMPVMVSKMSNNGILILSGFYEDDIQLLVDKAKSLGLELKEKKSKGDWRCLVLIPQQIV